MTDTAIPSPFFEFPEDRLGDFSNRDSNRLPTTERQVRSSGTTLSLNKISVGRGSSKMQEKRSGVPENHSGPVKQDKALSEELRDFLIRLCGPRDWSDNRESWLARGARAANISPRQAKTIFYRESENPAGKVVRAVQRAIERLDQTTGDAASGIFNDLSERIEAIEKIVQGAPDPSGVLHRDDGRRPRLGSRVPDLRRRADRTGD